MLTSGLSVIQYTTSNAAATDIPIAQPYIPPKIAKIKFQMLFEENLL